MVINPIRPENVWDSGLSEPGRIIRLIRPGKSWENAQVCRQSKSSGCLLFLDGTLRVGVFSWRDRDFLVTCLHFLCSRTKEVLYYRRQKNYCITEARFLLLFCFEGLLYYISKRTPVLHKQKDSCITEAEGRLSYREQRKTPGRHRARVDEVG